MGSGRWFRLSIGLVLVIVPLWALFSRLDAIWNGHPAYPTTLLVTVGGGLMLIAFALYPWRRDPEPNGPPWEADEREADQPGRRNKANRAPDPAERRRRNWRIAGRILTAVLALLLVGFLFWLRPFEAGADSLAAMQSDRSVSVVDTPTTIELSPVGAAPTVGLVFSPGARVDSRAYAALLRPVAEAGFLVVILKEPFGLAITQVGQAAGPISEHPEISTWAVGGHSLGGVSAASFAADNPGAVSGLLLWASYPNGNLSADTDLKVESISGTNDGLTTPADIEQSRAKLPPDTTFTVIDGGVHAFFADYGEQPGDGQPTIDRDTASAQIIEASTAFLDRLAAPVPAG